MNEDLRQLFKDLNELKSKVIVTEFFLKSFKDQELITTERLETLKQKLDTLDNKIYNNFKDIERDSAIKIQDIHRQLEQLKSQIGSIEINITKLSKSSLLSFGATEGPIDYKKWITIGGILISILTSAGLLDNFLSKNNTKETTEKVEQLLDLINK